MLICCSITVETTTTWSSLCRYTSNCSGMPDLRQLDVTLCCSDPHLSLIFLRCVPAHACPPPKRQHAPRSDGRSGRGVYGWWRGEHGARRRSGGAGSSGRQRAPPQLEDEVRVRPVLARGPGERARQEPQVLHCQSKAQVSLSQSPWWCPTHFNGVTHSALLKKNKRLFSGNCYFYHFLNTKKIDEWKLYFRKTFIFRTIGRLIIQFAWNMNVFKCSRTPCSVTTTVVRSIVM